jgi:hypothetical protein
MKYNGKLYTFVAGDVTPVDENEIPYRVLRTAYGESILSLIEDENIDVFNPYLEELVYEITPKESFNIEAVIVEIKKGDIEISEPEEVTEEEEIEEIVAEKLRDIVEESKEEKEMGDKNKKPVKKAVNKNIDNSNSSKPANKKSVNKKKK